MRVVAFIVLVFNLGGFYLTGSPAHAAEGGIEAFFGDYTGKSISDANAGLDQRDLSVSIRPAKKGFTLEWTTVIPKANGKESRKSYSVIFHRTPREHVYGSAMRKDMFGNLVPLNPMKGEPYIWGRLVEKTLSVYVLLVTDDGGYEMQAYHRTLDGDTMKLRFTRQRENTTLKVIEGVLKRDKE